MKRFASVESDYNNRIVSLRWGRQKYERLFWPCLIEDNNNRSNRRVVWLGTDQYSNIDISRTKDFGENFKETYKKDVFTPKEQWALYQLACRQAVAIAHKFGGKGSSINGIDWNNLDALDFTELPNIRTTYKDACSISATIISPTVDEPVGERTALRMTKSRSGAKGKRKTFTCTKCPQKFQTFLARCSHVYKIHLKATEDSGPSTNEGQNTVPSAEYDATMDDHSDLPPGFSVPVQPPRAKKSIVRMASAVANGQSMRNTADENDIEIVYVKNESTPAPVVQNVQVGSGTAVITGTLMACHSCPFSTQNIAHFVVHTVKHSMS